jgi:hypothetical protein
MESIPYGLKISKKKKKKAQKNNNKANEVNDVNDVNEINKINTIIITANLIIKSIMDKYDYYPKTNYFINNKNDEKFPEDLIFEKLFPNFTSFFTKLDYNFSATIDNKTYTDKNKDMGKDIKKYIMDQSHNWNPDIVQYIGYFWDLLDKKVKYHTIIFLYMANEFINKDKLSDYDKNILYWAILFHDVGKFHEMNTIYKEDYSKNKFMDKAHPFKSAIIFIQTVINKKLVFFENETEKKEFIDFFEKPFTTAIYKSFEKEETKYDSVYNINFKNFEDIEKFLLKLKLHKENKWIYEVMILIIFHQSLPNNDPDLHGRHVNEPILDIKYIDELFDVRLLELMRIILIYDSSSHCLFGPSKWEQKIDKHFDILIRKKLNNLSQNPIVYLAELDGDVDDVVAVEYLYNNYALKCVVCDPKPSTGKGKERERDLKKLGIEIYYEIPEDTDIVFCGGALTNLSKFLEKHKISTLVMNGGFVGDNIVPKEDRLKKFDGLKTIRTFNFDFDVDSTDKVLKSSEEKIGKIILVGKNVCHSEKNTPNDIWNLEEYDYLFEKYKVKGNKCLHDMLMCHEGLCLLNLINEKPYCEFKEVYPYNEGLDGNMTKWGSKKDNKNTPYRKVLAAIKYS